MDEVMAWLLQGSPWVRYRTRLDLLDLPEDEPEVRVDRAAMMAHPHIQSLVADLQAWPGPLLKSHKDAKHPLHALVFLADLGLRVTDPGIERAVGKILEHQSREGIFQVLVNIKPGYGGTGQDQWAWMLCDAPLIIYALVKLDPGQDSRFQAAVGHLVSLIRENGWPCAVSAELGKFRGPGRKDDPCPYANLLMLKLLGELPEWRNHKAARAGAAALLDLWERRTNRRPYLFAMGTDFAKLKAPLIWYDILHVLHVLSRFSWLGDDTRLQEMVTIVRAKADEQGRFTPESIWTAWKGWDFGQKRHPSEWLTLLTRRTLKSLSV